MIHTFDLKGACNSGIVLKYHTKAWSVKRRAQLGINWIKECGAVAFCQREAEKAAPPVRVGQPFARGRGEVSPGSRPCGVPR